MVMGTELIVKLLNRKVNFIEGLIGFGRKRDGNKTGYKNSFNKLIGQFGLCEKYIWFQWKRETLLKL
jgi:hypothetical protein